MIVLKLHGSGVRNRSMHFESQNVLFSIIILVLKIPKELWCRWLVQYVYMLFRLSQGGGSAIFCGENSLSLDWWFRSVQLVPMRLDWAREGKATNKPEQYATWLFHQQRVLVLLLYTQKFHIEFHVSNANLILK